MIHQDTVRLLRECDAGIKMGIASIADVLPRTEQQNLEKTLSECKKAHESLQSEILGFLDRYQDQGKNPNPIARTMSKIKTSVKLCTGKPDATIAELMTDGCNMGVKSLSRYLNQYAAADESSKDITKRLVKLEEALAVDMRQYL